jgi:RNA polymerase sigma factor (sigma-70 family)
VDLETLYPALAPRLERIVRCDVHAPDAVIEDACQFAWSRLAHHAGHVRSETALSWLATTAVHEAIKLVRRDRRELSLELAAEESPAMLLHATVPGPEEVFEQREQLASIHELPVRQQRMVWMHALGLSYADIAASTDSSSRTVERQLLRARRSLRAA